MEQKRYKIEEVAMMIGVSTQTLNRWYKFKRDNPEHEFSIKLPDYDRVSAYNGIVRLWPQEAVWKLIEIKQSVKTGRTGIMGKYHGAGTRKGAEA